MSLAKCQNGGNYESLFCASVCITDGLLNWSDQRGGQHFLKRRHPRQTRARARLRPTERLSNRVHAFISIFLCPSLMNVFVCCESALLFIVLAWVRCFCFGWGLWVPPYIILTPLQLALSSLQSLPVIRAKLVKWSSSALSFSHLSSQTAGAQKWIPINPGVSSLSHSGYMWIYHKYNIHKLC